MKMCVCVCVCVCCRVCYIDVAQQARASANKHTKGPKDAHMEKHKQNGVCGRPAPPK